MNLGQLKTHVANRTGNDSIDSVLTEFVNQVQYDFCSRFPFSWRKSLPVSINSVANQNYLNPSAYLPGFGDPIDAFELSTPQKLIYLPEWNIGVVDPDWFKTSPTNKGRPTHYSIQWNDQDQSLSRLWLYPTPDSAYQLRFRYLRNPPEISNTSSSLFIPAKYHYGVAAGVESLVWQMDEDLKSSSAANQRYEAVIARAIDEENNLPDYQPHFEAPSIFVDYSDPFLEM